MVGGAPHVNGRNKILSTEHFLCIWRRVQEFWIQLNRESKSRLWKIDKIATSFWRAGIWQLYASKKDVFKSTDQPATLTIRKQRENISFCDSCSLTMPSKFFAISNELESLREPSHGFYLNCTALLPLTLRLLILPNHSSWKTRPLFRLLGGTTTSLSPPIPWFSGH